MLDLIGAISVTAGYAVIVGTLAGFARATVRQKSLAVSAAALWGAAVVAAAGVGAFGPGALGAVPVPVLAAGAALAILILGWRFLPALRAALMSVPLPALIALNSLRIGGVMFLLLAPERLSAPFAPTAGWGDIITGALAIPVALGAARGLRHGTIGLWNAFGAADLLVAVSLGALSAPNSPIRLFTQEPGTVALTQLPWILVPTTLVPIYLLIHFVIAAKLRPVPRIAARPTAA